MENGNKKKKKGLSKGGLIAIIIVAVILICSVLAGVIYINKLKNAPEDLFNTITEPAPSKEPEPIVNDDKESNRPKPSPTLSDFEKLQQNADTSIMQNIVNVLLIGVDYAEERTSANPNWTGKTSYHADVMIILAINFDENTVDMISVPRDTMIKSMPGVGGIYKMNASLDCGGGFPDGFEKVMEANEWMIGGIPIDYYYAVTMHGCKDLVNAIGGVYYDLDIDFTLAGREYKAGYQYMDGQAVLDYLRVRKNEGKSSLSGKTGDLNRINRQKDMLVAIFNKLKSKKMLTKLPEILDAFEGQFYTNVNFSQTAALALFGMGLDSKDISMHSMSGKMRSVYNWSFCLTDQQKRVKLIKEIYGVNMDIYKDHTEDAIITDWMNIAMPIYLNMGQNILNNAAITGIPDKVENGVPVRNEEAWMQLEVCKDLHNQLICFRENFNGNMAATHPLIDFKPYIESKDYTWMLKFIATYKDNMRKLAKTIGDKNSYNAANWEYPYEGDESGKVPKWNYPDIELTLNEMYVDFR